MTQRTTSVQPEWLLEVFEQLSRRDADEIPGRLETGDPSALLTDVQRAALRWISSFD